MTIKEIFAKAQDGTLTYDQFEALAKENETKFTDLAEGKYVSKSKYDSDLKAKSTEVETANGRIEELNATIATRDTDLATLQKQLEDAGQDATKLAEVQAQFTGLQTKYDKDVADYQAKMEQQAYEFAVKEFANTKKFSSAAAKRDFTQSMLAKKLQMENGKLIGGEDFVSIYSQENADAFYVEPPVAETEPTPVQVQAPIPEITASAQGLAKNDDSDVFQFNFTGVR